MAETLGVTESAIAVVKLGFKLTKNIAGYLNDVSTARQQLEGITSNIKMPTAPGPGSNHLFLAAIKDDTPTNRDATTPTSQCVTEPQLADCIEGLRDMICKIWLLQQALSTIYPISKCLEDNRKPEAASDVKKKLEAIVGSCIQQQQVESPTENTQTDHSKPIGRDTRVKKVLRRLKRRSRSTWSSFSRIKETSSVMEPSYCTTGFVRMSHPIDEPVVSYATPYMYLAAGGDTYTRCDETACKEQAVYSYVQTQSRARLNFDEMSIKLLRTARW